MLGAVFGDIVGSAYEWNNVKTKEFPLKTSFTRYTDDSVMTLAVAQWLMTDPEHSEEGLVREMQRLGRGHFKAGYGGRFKAWLMSKEPQPYNSWGNGSAMRVSPVALYATSLEEALELARKTANVTHNHSEGIKGALSVAECVFICKEAKDIETAKEEIRRTIPQKYGYDLDRTLDEIRPGYKFDVSCQGSVPEAIIAFLESTLLEDCVRNAVSIGGDSDTIAAIACSIYAANKEWSDESLMSQFTKYLPGDLRAIMESFEELVFPVKPIRNSYKVMEGIYAGEYPREYDDKKSINKIKQFKRFGITHLIDLTEEGELRPYDQMLASPMQHIRFPIQDVSVPANIESVKDLIGQIHGILNESDRNKVYIHCWGGVGRTGTIVGCLLSHQHNYDYNETMGALKKAFSDCPKSAYRETPETKEQRDFIARYAAEMKQEELGRQALMMWKMGAGNSAKRFNGENPIPQKTKVATKDSWNIEPMPEKHTTIPMDESIPSAAMHIVKYGHIPDAMEYHWFMCCDETTIRYYRSWTGFCIYVAKYEDDGKTCRITDLTVNRELEQYSCTDDKHDVALFMALLTEEYGGDASEYWQKAF